MSRKINEYVREHLLKKKKRKLREESINDVIQNNFSWFKNNNINLRIIFSPKDYPHTYERLDFNEWEFNDFFKRLINFRYTHNKISDSIQFFDPTGEQMDWTQLDHPPIPDFWMDITRTDDIENSIIIKNDGVIYFNSSQNYNYEDKSVLDLKKLHTNLQLLMNQIIPKIYEKMNYNKKLSIDIECFGINDCCLLERSDPPIYKEPRNQTMKFKKSYVLHLENPIKIHLNIIRDIRVYFES